MTLRTLTAIAIVTLVQGAVPPAMAGDASGAYLAARQARYDHDYAAAADYFTRALTEDQSNPAIMENAVVAHAALGNFDRALPIARKIEADDLRSQVAQMVLVADEVQQEDYDALLTRLEDGRGVGQLADGLIAAWAHLGQGDMSRALDLFDSVAEERGLRGFAIYHKALALASVGDFEGADQIFAGESDGPMQRTRRGMLAWAEVLSQLDRNEDAVAQIDDTFGTDLDPEIQQLRDRLVAGDRVPFSMIGGAADGVAEVFFSLGRALLSDMGEDYTLLYSRVAEHLSPDHIDAMIMSAELLESLGRYELATVAYKRVPRDHPSFLAAELGRADTLRRADKTDAAIEVLEQLAQTHPDQPTVHVSAGDLFRQLEQFDNAASAYDKAIALYEERKADQWFVHYARAISYERQGIWDKAEADFRRALELNPEQPQVLNYLGYSLVEKQIKLDEALNMIERAVAAQPDSGYIVDSLGWILYRLGRYDEAIGHMERAAELMPVDPVVNDHLGDVLWAVGRETEARFQWRRALSFVTEDTPEQDIDPDRIRRKLEVGLDQVLEEEGAPPLKVADDGE
ncbi:tetratricopeptide repeat protein [Roseovarius sp. MMSF_3281]|uniref:tetratricopeptide repeat protein n=1 Tax=Roseovarius sp. MMSF_3281 TaxID=3046694 RepID=UPI00273DF55E|nr:tetratricopeptide repeat protein [Roseovarius sp. MMSF_3281]